MGGTLYGHVSINRAKLAILLFSYFARHDTLYVRQLTAGNGSLVRFEILRSEYSVKYKISLSKRQFTSST